MVRWVGISAVAIAAFVAFMAVGSGRAAGGSADAAASKNGSAGAAGAGAVAPAGHGGADAGAAAHPDDAKSGVESQPRKSPGGTKSHHGGPGKPKEAPEDPIGQGPPPPSPLTMGGLHQELDRDRSAGANPDAPPRVKLELLLADVVKARESLHQDTQRLEAMAGNEGAEEGSPSPRSSSVSGQSPQKDPLDVLAKALRGIKPEQAAPIVARLDKGLAATVLLKMPPGDAGKIMGALKPEVAAELATQIAMRAPATRAGVRR